MPLSKGIVLVEIDCGSAFSIDATTPFGISPVRLLELAELLWLGLSCNLGDGGSHPRISSTSH
eukprot:7393568-Pyramimonas_sp.AAC.1